jgi:hypothetical protein
MHTFFWLRYFLIIVVFKFFPQKFQVGQSVLDAHLTLTRIHPSMKEEKTPPQWFVFCFFLCRSFCVSFHTNTLDPFEKLVEWHPQEARPRLRMLRTWFSMSGGPGLKFKGVLDRVVMVMATATATAQEWTFQSVGS